MVHRSDSPEEQRIDPEFYIEFASHVHEGSHHEMQLVKSPAFGRVHPEIPIHVHKHPHKDEHYVCYTPQVKTLDHAREIFRMWCVGTIYSIEEAKDFAPMVGQHPDDFLQFMTSQYGISIVE